MKKKPIIATKNSRIETENVTSSTPISNNSGNDNEITLDEHRRVVREESNTTSTAIIYDLDKHNDTNTSTSNGDLERSCTATTSNDCNMDTIQTLNSSTIETSFSQQERDKVTKQQLSSQRQRRQSDDEKTIPGAYPTSVVLHNNSTTNNHNNQNNSTTLNRLIAKTRGDISALLPNQNGGTVDPNTTTNTNATTTSTMTDSTTMTTTTATTQPGAYAVSGGGRVVSNPTTFDTSSSHSVSTAPNSNNNNNTSSSLSLEPVSDHVRRLIAKSRGDASALIPYQGIDPNTIIIDHETTSNTNTAIIADTMTQPGAYSVPTTNSNDNNNNTSSAPVSEHVRRLIAKSRGDASALIPFQNVQKNAIIDQGVTASNITDCTEINTQPGIKSISNNNTTQPDSEKARKLSVKTCDTITALTPFQIELCNIVDQHDAANTQWIADTTTPGAQSVSTSHSTMAPVSEQVLRLIAKSRGDISALQPYQNEHEIIINPDAAPSSVSTFSSTVDTLAPASEHVRRLIAKSRGDASALIPYQNEKPTSIQQIELSNETQIPNDITQCTTLINDLHLEGSGLLQYKSEEDLEFGAHLNQNQNIEDGLAVAKLVALEDNSNNLLLTTAIEYDSDAKTNCSVRNQRLHLFIFLIVSALVISTIGLALGIILPSNLLKEANERNVLSYRETIGIYENIARVVIIKELNDKNSPYKKALDWITFSDPLLLTPDHPRFMQRYLMSYFYFATSITGNWTSPCGPDSNGKRDDCKYSVPSLGHLIVANKWLSKQSECDWAGIKCDHLSQVIAINVAAVGMTGSFPHGILMLPYLHELSLESGTLSGRLLESFSRHDSKVLSVLSIINNTFTGSIPEIWFHTRSLNMIKFASNLLTGTVSTNISKLIDLRELDFSKNELTGSLPSELSRLQNLLFLGLSSNKFTGSIPSTYGQMTYLYSLLLSDNLLTGTIPKEIGHLKNYFQDFSVERNRLTGPIPESFWNAQSLQYIRLEDNALTGTISKNVFKLKQLEELSISNNMFSGTLPPRIGRARVFFKFSAYGNHFNGTVPQHLCDLVEEGTLKDLETDCSIPSSFSKTTSSTFVNDSAEISCPIGCCTLCCAGTPNGILCK